MGDIASPWLLLVLIPVVSAGLGFWAGSFKHAEGPGSLLGLLLGPFGVIVAAVIDRRVRCPGCYNRIDDDVKLCPVCRVTIDWKRDRGSLFPWAKQPFIAAAPDGQKKAVTPSTQKATVPPLKKADPVTKVKVAKAEEWVDKLPHD